jgi:hypothetical protein
VALIVEDGTGLVDAESYIAVADATTYHANRGNAAWAALASDAVREQLLRKATDYMVQVYRLRWKGWRVTTTQALDWPRSEVERADYAALQTNGYTTISGDYYYPADEVPREVTWACAELALKANDGDLAADIEQLIKREKVGPIEVEYADYSRAEKVFRAIDLLLAPFLNGMSGTFRKVIRT